MITRITRSMRLPAILVAWVALFAASTPLQAQSRYEVAHTFSQANPQGGVSPSSGPMAKGDDGSLYGITDAGGAFGSGTVFRIAADGTVTTIASFDADLGVPSIGSGLLRASDGAFYGTTENGGASFEGAIFRVTPDGTVSVWAELNSTDVGATPGGRLIEGRDGYIYGTALFGPGFGPGVVFRVAQAWGSTGTGVIEPYAVFNADETAGTFPSSGVTEGPDGFYGAAEAGGAFGHGTIFRATSGDVSAVHSFSSTDGSQPASPLLLASDGNLYGTTMAGGATAIDGNPGAGTLFQLALDGSNTLTTVVSFDGVNGEFPYQQGVVEAGDYLFGTTQVGGEFAWGALYRWSKVTGAIDVLRSFDGVLDQVPNSTLTVANDGSLYGTAFGPDGGLIFRVVKDDVASVLALANATANFGGSATLVATLSAAGEPLAGAEVIFSLNGSAVGIGTTDASGVATLAGVSVVGIPVGTRAGAISASFVGRDNVLGSTASADLTVLFVDVTPPVLQLPGKLTVNATSPLGATVNYVVTATDNSGKPVTISCSPLSGSVFAIGTREVKCTATDQAGNVAIGKFSVKVLSAAEQIVGLIEKLRGMPLSSVIKKLLVGYLETAAANPKHATLVCTTLDYFLSFAKRYASPTQYAALLADVRRIQTVLGCR
jgi:uncharacterized repeat protein (TIGR03803 family)